MNRVFRKSDSKRGGRGGGKADGVIEGVGQNVQGFQNVRTFSKCMVFPVKMYRVLILDLLFASKKVCNPEAFDGFKVADLNGGCDFILTGKSFAKFGKQISLT